MFACASSAVLQLWQVFIWSISNLAEVQLESWVSAVLSLRSLRWGVNSFSGIFFLVIRSQWIPSGYYMRCFLGTLPLRLLVDSPMVFTRLSESLASGLDLEVTEIQTCLRFVADGSKIWISKPYIALFRNYCTHKLGCPPCLLTCWGDNNSLSAFYGWGVKTVSDQKYMDITVDRIKPPCVFAHILLASRYEKLWASCGEWLDPRPAACSWLPSP